MKPPKVSIVVVNWNRAELTVACLASLAHLDYPSFEVIVVDNGSTDDSPAVIGDAFPNVTLLTNERNLGFAQGSNIGMHVAMQRGADYILLLNNDTEVAPDVVRALVDVGEADSSVGILGPKIFYFDQRDVIWSAGAAIDSYGRASHLRENQTDDGSPEDVRDMAYVTGCAMLVKRKVIETVGLLDSRFFMYFEESEWCARARRAGFRVVYVPQARMWHKIKMEARNASRWYTYLIARNRLLYLRCVGASPWTVIVAALDLLRLAVVWSIRPRHHDKRRLASALVLGIGAFVGGRFGAAPSNI